MKLAYPVMNMSTKGDHDVSEHLLTLSVCNSIQNTKTKQTKKPHPVHTKTTYPKNTCSIWGKKKDLPALFVEIKDVPGN